MELLDLTDRGSGPGGGWGGGGRGPGGAGGYDGGGRSGRCGFRRGALGGLRRGANHLLLELAGGLFGRLVLARGDFLGGLVDQASLGRELLDADVGGLVAALAAPLARVHLPPVGVLAQLDLSV